MSVTFKVKKFVVKGYDTWERVITFDFDLCMRKKVSSPRTLYLNVTHIHISDIHSHVSQPLTLTFV
jgi:hypothetical protein